jgi:hypothetical protein
MPPPGTKPRFFVASVAAAAAVFVVAVLLGLAASWFEMPYTSPDGAPDNAPIRAAGIMIVLSPIIFVVLTAFVFFTTLILRAIHQLKPRMLFAIPALLSIGTAALMVSDRPFGWHDRLHYFAGFVVLLFVPAAVGAWVWWKVAMRPNTAVHPDAREASLPFSPSQSRAGDRKR